MIDQYEDLLKRAEGLAEEMTRLFHAPQERVTREVLASAIENTRYVEEDVTWLIEYLKGQ